MVVSTEQQRNRNMDNEQSLAQSNRFTMLPRPSVRLATFQDCRLVVRKLPLGNLQGRPHKQWKVWIVESQKKAVALRGALSRPFPARQTADFKAARIPSSAKSTQENTTQLRCGPVRGRQTILQTWHGITVTGCLRKACGGAVGTV